jgi:peroxiredoxin
LLQDNLARLAELPAHVLGLSVDSVYAHAAFADQLGELDYPLLADFHPKGEVAQAYGLWRPERGYSRRAMVIVDPAGVIRHVQVIERGLPDFEQILAAARAALRP